MWQTFLDGTLALKGAAWDESKVKRQPAGAPDSKGGEFAPKGDVGNGMKPLDELNGRDDIRIRLLHGGDLIADAGVPMENVGLVRGMLTALPYFSKVGLGNIVLRSDDGNRFEAGGQNFQEGGHYEPANGNIVLFGMDKQVSETDMQFLLSHEAGHNLWKQFNEMSDMQMAAAAMSNAIDTEGLKSDESLVLDSIFRNSRFARNERRKFVQAAIEKYPYAAAMVQFDYTYASGNGVTSYSQAWSKQNARAGINETFAELTRLYVRDVMDGVEPLWAFYRKDKPEYKWHKLADAYINATEVLFKPILRRTPATKAAVSARPVRKFFDANGNEAPPERAVMAMEHTTDGGETIYFAEGYADGE